MKKYITMGREEFDIDSFPPIEKEFYEKIKFINEKYRPGWNDFSNLLRSHARLYLEDAGYTREEIVNLPVWKICQDLEGRIGIDWGYVKRPEDESVLSETGEIVSE